MGKHFFGKGFLQKSAIKSLLCRINNDKNCYLRGVRFFDIIFRSSDRMNIEFIGDFYLDFCRMSKNFSLKSFLLI